MDAGAVGGGGAAALSGPTCALSGAAGLLRSHSSYDGGGGAWEVLELPVLELELGS